MPDSALSLPAKELSTNNISPARIATTGLGLIGKRIEVDLRVIKKGFQKDRKW